MGHLPSLFEPNQTKIIAKSSKTPSLTNHPDLALLYRLSQAYLIVRWENPVKWFIISSCSMYVKACAVDITRKVSLTVISYSFMNGIDETPIIWPMRSPRDLVTCNYG